MSLNFSAFFKNMTARGGGRTQQVRQQIIYSFLIKIISVLIGLMLVPLLIDALSAERYAIWLTLSSIFSWFSFFDIGLGNGLRNKLAEAIANDEHALAKEYVSTTYAMLGGIFLILLLVFWIINPFLDWQAILNVRLVARKELFILTTLVFTFFLLRFIFQLVGVVYIAMQKPATNNFVVTAGNFLAFVSILIVYKLSLGSLLLYSCLLVGFPLVVLIFWTFVAYRGAYAFLKPEMKSVKFFHMKVLLNLGTSFLVIQIGAIVLFSTANIIILRLFEPAEVVSYTSAMIFYQLPVMVYGIVMAPVWSAVTDAYSRKDFQWLRLCLKKLNKLSIAFVLGIVVMLLLSPYVFHIWLGDRVKIPLILSVSMATFAMINVVLAPYTSFLNGIGKLRFTMYSVLISIVIYFPLAVVLSKWLGSSAGIMFATCLVNGVGLYFQPLQVRKLLGQNAQGIWAK